MKNKNILERDFMAKAFVVTPAPGLFERTMRFLADSDSADLYRGFLTLAASVAALLCVALLIIGG